MKRFVKVIFIFLVLASIGCDQLTKSVARRNIGEHENIALLGNHFTLMRVENRGAFLSNGSTLPEPIRFMLLTLMPAVVLALGLLYILTRKDLPHLVVLAASFIIGGGIGNLYDRVRSGSVTDFLHIDFGLFQTGIFNLADVSIMIGTFLLAIHALQRPQPTPSS
ncbi:signal peptidase II [Chryseolinea lacunae]|uniref:Lipoprotein signal peptidase n=1 Tax=Chryseolinea lacunae TaxID=2801331 RepID=A0ABS1KUG0_9BACT|nr:signal peptidase II [Chryseolinea lacunae]MBL0742342.1 signal peptidase II [Chryseolinea lacunae]